MDTHTVTLSLRFSQLILMLERVGTALNEGAARPPGGCNDAAPPLSSKSFASNRARRLDILRVDALDVIARGWRPGSGGVCYQDTYPDVL